MPSKKTRGINPQTNPPEAPQANLSASPAWDPGLNLFVQGGAPIEEYLSLRFSATGPVVSFKDGTTIPSTKSRIEAHNYNLDRVVVARLQGCGPRKLAGVTLQCSLGQVPKVFTPNDHLISRGAQITVATDNLSVVFSLGNGQSFSGKLKKTDHPDLWTISPKRI